MQLLPIRLVPGTDLRAAVEAELARAGCRAGFVVAGIGSLREARLRFAGLAEATLLSGDLELLSLAGSLAPGASHLHASVSDASGRVCGGHVAPGCIVRTTAELLLAFLPAWQFAREHDPATGYAELAIKQAPP